MKTQTVGRNLLFFCCLLLAIPSVQAQPDDVLGLFFETGGTSAEHTTAAEPEMVTAWLLLMNPSQTEEICGWECSIETMTDLGSPVVIWTLEGAGINMAVVPEFRVGLGTPPPWAETVVLATAQIYVPTFEDSFLFFLHPCTVPSVPDPAAPGYFLQRPVYSSGETGEILTALNLSSGCPSIPVAAINTELPTEALFDLVSIDVDTLDFGIVPLSGAASRHLTLHNDGALRMTGSLRVTGDHYIVRQSMGAYVDGMEWSLETGGTMNLEVRFITEPAIGNGHGLLEIIHCEEILESVVLTGEYPGEPPLCEVSVDTLDFGDVAVGDSTILELVVTNHGGGVITGFPSVTADDFDHGLASQLLAVPRDEQQTIQVCFRPSAVGSQTAELQPGEGACAAVVLLGTGLSSPAECVLSQETVHFSEVQVGDPRPECRLTVRNNGSGLLTGSVPESSEFFPLLAGAGAFSLAFDETHEFTIGFCPDTVGEYNHSLALGPESCAVELSGLAVEPHPVAVFSPGSLAFGSVVFDLPLDEAPIMAAQLVNLGQTVLSTTISLDDPEFELIVGGGLVELAFGEIHSVTVRYRPTEEGYHWGSIEVPLPSPYPSGYLYFQGDGILEAPDCVIAPSSLRFFRQRDGVTPARDFFVVQNQGDSSMPLNIEWDPGYDGTSLFTIVSGDGQYELPVGESHIVEVAAASEVQTKLEARLLIGSSCDFVRISINSPFDTGGPGWDENSVGLYFDQLAQTRVAHVAAAGEVLTAYLIIFNTEPAEAWEGRIDLPSGLVAQNWRVIGGVNEMTAPDFRVALGGDTAGDGATVLLELDIEVSDGLSDYEIYLSPLAEAALPNQVSYVLANDFLSVPLQSTWGDLTLPAALIQGATSTAVQAPAPTLRPTANGVHLNWTFPAHSADQCHVYRRLTGQAWRRLTTEPLIAASGVLSFHDPLVGVAPGSALFYMYSVLRDGAEIARSPEVSLVLGGVPTATILLPCYPNPFNPTTRLRFSLKSAGHARLEIFDAAGRRVRVLVDEVLPATTHEREWHGYDEQGRRAASGVYYVRLSTPSYQGMQKMVLLK